MADSSHKSPLANTPDDTTADNAAEKLLDSLLDEYTAPPEELERNIRLAIQDVREEEDFLREEERQFPRRRRTAAYWSAAAALVLLCALGAMNFSREAVCDSKGFHDAAETYAAPKLALSPEYSRTDAAPVRVSDASLGFSLQDSLALPHHPDENQNVTAVSTCHTMLRGSRNHAMLSPVDQEVIQVWLAEKPVSSNGLLEILKMNDCDAQFASSDELGVTTAVLMTDDISLQALTDKLYSQEHWALLTPESPQPGKSSDTPLQGHPVKYTIRVVAEYLNP